MSRRPPVFDGVRLQGSCGAGRIHREAVVRRPQQWYSIGLCRKWGYESCSERTGLLSGAQLTCSAGKVVQAAEIDRPVGSTRRLFREEKSRPVKQPFHDRGV
jgi:hypothetical protein